MADDAPKPAPTGFRRLMRAVLKPRRRATGPADAPGPAAGSTVVPHTLDPTGTVLSQAIDASLRNPLDALPAVPATNVPPLRPVPPPHAVPLPEIPPVDTIPMQPVPAPSSVPPSAVVPLEPIPEPLPEIHPAATGSPRAPQEPVMSETLLLEDKGLASDGIAAVPTQAPTAKPAPLPSPGATEPLKVAESPIAAAAAAAEIKAGSPVVRAVPSSPAAAPIAQKREAAAAQVAARAKGICWGKMVGIGTGIAAVAAAVVVIANHHRAREQARRQAPQMEQENQR